MAASAIIGNLRVNLGLDSAQFQRGAAQAEGRMRGFEQSAQRMVRALAAVGVALGTAVSLRKFVDATAESERAQAQLAAAIQSTGGVAGRTIEQLNASAAALQRVTTFGDEAVNAMQGVLLTFTSIGGAQFDAATQAVLNLSTAMGTNLNAAALQVGKALNDPVGGINSLTRAGIQFTEAQKATIRSLVEMGDVAGAQTVILAELERQFGGSAEAARETLGGALKALENAWGDLFEIGGPAADNLRLSIEELIATISDPAFVEAFQAIGSGMFNALNAALQAVQGLRMALQDIGYLVGYTNTTALMDAALVRAAAALDENVGAAGRLAAELPRGVAISRDMTTAKLAEAEAYLAAARASSQQAAQVVAQSNEYQSLTSDIRSIEARIASLVETMGEMNIANQEFGFEQFDTTQVSGQIVGLRLELGKLVEEQKNMLASAADLGPEYVAVLVEIDRIRAALANATGETVTLDNATANAATTGSALSTTLANITMGGQPIGQAALLAQQLGIALDVATRLNATLNQQAGTGTSQAPRLGFGLGSTMDNPLSNGLANTVLGFGNVTQAADETWRAVRDLSGGMADLARTAGGSAPGGAARALEEVADISETLNGILREFNTQQAQEYRDNMQAIADDAIGGLGNALEDFAESGFRDFNSLMDGMVDAAADAVAQITAEFASRQLASALGSFAGPIGGLLGSLAGGLFSRLFGGGGGGGMSDQAQTFWDQRIGLMDQFYAAMGQMDQLRRRELNRLEPGNRALQKRVWALEDEAAIAAEEVGLRQQLLQLQGKTGELRRLELKALDPSNRALQKRIWALEDEAKAAAKAREERRKQMQEEREARQEERAERMAFRSERGGLQRQLLELLGETDKLRAMELAELDPANRALQERIWALQDEKKAADGAAEAVERLTTSLSTSQFRSLFQYERAVGLARFGGMAPANIPGAPDIAATGGTAGGGMASSDVLLSRMLSRLARMEQTLRKWDSEGQPPERVYA